MARTATVRARVEPSLKNEAEAVLNTLLPSGQRLNRLRK
jgi:antitoxin component of RelBE/YafQ-DinJ toxin-antitoxin module